MNEKSPRTMGNARKRCPGMGWYKEQPFVEFWPGDRKAANLATKPAQTIEQAAYWCKKAWAPQRHGFVHVCCPNVLHS